MLKQFPFIEGNQANKVKGLISNWVNRRLLNKSHSKILVTAAVHVHYDAIDMKTLSSFLDVQPMDIIKFLKNDDVNNSNFSLRHPLNVSDFLRKGLLKLTSNTYPLINELLEECVKIFNILNDMNYCEGKNPNVIATAITRIVCSTNIKGKIYKVSDIVSAFDVCAKSVKIRYSDMIQCFRKLLSHLPWYRSDYSENDILKEIPYIIKNGNTLVKVYNLSSTITPEKESYVKTEDTIPIPIEPSTQSLSLLQDPVVLRTPPPTTTKSEIIEQSTQFTDISLLSSKSIDMSRNYSINETNILPQSESMEVSQIKTPSTSESKKHKLIRETPTPRLSKKTCIRKESKNIKEEKRRKSLQKRRTSNRILTSEGNKK